MYPSTRSSGAPYRVKIAGFVYFRRIASTSSRDGPVYALGMWSEGGIGSGARGAAAPLPLALRARGAEVDAIVMGYARTATSGCGAAYPSTVS